MYDIKIIKKEQQQTSSWAGGTTTQLYIYPTDSNYGNRDFLWRLSTALVELEESSFTSLPGFDRHLMVLEGRLRIVHKGHHEVVLEQFDKDFFKGSWDTTSYGRARDFNLMLREGSQGSLKHYLIRQGEIHEIKLKAAFGKKCFFTCYCYGEKISLNINDRNFYIEKEDLLLIEYDENLTVAAENKGSEECSLIAAFIEI